MRVEEVRVVKTRKEERGIAVVKLEEGDKRKVMERKKGLKGGKVWIEDDLMSEERRSRWRFREVVAAEERRGMRV